MTTRHYEALIILKAAGTEQDMARSAAQLEELVKKFGGKIENSQGLGRRRLAFRIARHTEGYYHLLRFHGPTAHVGELERLFRLNESIIRFMILSEDELSPMPLGPSMAAGGPSTLHATATPTRS